MQLQGSLISVPRATGLEEEEDGEADDESRHDQRQRRRRRRHAEVLRGEQRALSCQLVLCAELHGCAELRSKSTP